MISLKYQRIGRFLGFSLLLVLTFAATKIANADSIDWISQPPKISVETERPIEGSTTGNNRQVCQPQEISVEGDPNIMSSCVYQARSFQMAFYKYCPTSEECTGNQQVPTIAFKFPADSRFRDMYDANGWSPVYSSWRVSPYTDTVLVANGTTTIAIKDLPSQVTFSPDVNKFVLYTTPDKSRVLSVFDDGQYLTIGGNADMSANGQWAVLFLKNRGHIKINLSDYSYKFFTIDNPAISYEYAISNDGRFIATNAIVDFSFSGGGYIYDTEDSCGTVSSNGVRRDWLTVDSSCPGSRYDLGIPHAFENGIHSTVIDHLSFSDDGGELELMATTTPNGNTVTQWYKLTAANYTGTPSLDYLALGDSISSGEGDTEVNSSTNQKYYRDHTDVEEDKTSDQPREKCHLSTRSYPYHLATWMDLGQSEWNSVACSGAAVGDIYGGNRDDYLGQAKGGGSDTPRLAGYSNAGTLQEEAVAGFIPGRLQQINFVEKYHPKAITITMGANDIGFAAKLQACALPNKFGFPYTCDLATTHKQELAKVIQNEYDVLVSLFRKLREQSGGETKVYAIGYPHIISAAEPASCGLNTGSLDKTERQLIDSATDYLNTVIEHAANATGIKYVDISHALDGGRLCDEGQEYMTGYNLIRVPFGSDEAQESFHPNDYGHIKITQAIEQVLNHQSLLDFTIQPGADTAKPDIPASLGGNTDRNVRSTHVVSDAVTKGQTTEMKAGRYTWSPDGHVHLTLHSDPIDLGDVTVSSDGSIDTTITIPTSVTPGYHTLILTGQTYGGEPIEQMQTVLVKGSDPTDIDENGTPDSQQTCGPFMFASGVDEDADSIDDACDLTINVVPVDQTAPTLGGPSWSVNPVIAGESTTVSIPASDDLSGVANGEYYIGDTDPGQGNATSMTLTASKFTATLSNLSAGIQVIHYRARDNAGNWTDVKTTTVTVRPQAPINIFGTTPTNSSPLIYWAATTGADHYTVYRDGTALGNTQKVNYIDTAVIQQGTHSYSVIAVTADGVISKPSVSLAVVYDTVSPQVSNLRLAGSGVISFLGLNAVLGMNQATIFASASDSGSGVYSGEYYIDTDPGQGNGVPMVYTTSGTITISTRISLSFGLHELCVRAIDKAGNWGNVTTIRFLYL